MAFAQAQGFPYRLLSDVDRQAGRAYGAERGPEEKNQAYAKRLTFLIDPEGTIRKVYQVTDFSGHPAEVLSDIGELAAS